MAVRFVRDRATWLAYWLSLYWAYVLNVLGPLTPFLRAELGLDYTLASLHFSAFAAGMLLAGALADRVTARLGRRRTLWAGAFGLAAGALVLMVGRTPLVTIAACFGMGLVGSWVQAVYPAVLASRHGRFAAVAFTEATILGSAGAAAAALLLGLLAYTPVGWRAALLLPLLALGPLFLLYRSEPLTGSAGAGGDAAQSPAQTRGLPLPRAYWAYWVVLVAVIAIEFCIVFWVADFVHSERGLSRADAALATTAFLGAILAGRIISSRLLFRLPPQRLLLGSLAVAGVGFLIFWLLQPITVVAAGLILAGLGVANLYPTTLALAVGTAPAQLDQAAARGSLASGTAILALPLLLGSMADSIGIAAAFGLVGVLTVVAVAILLAATALLRRTGAIPHTGQSA